MNRLTRISCLLFVLHSTSNAIANVKITPIGVDSMSSVKPNDLKVEEARTFREPVIPEYYGSNYDRNQPKNFVTSYGGSTTYDRYGGNTYGGNNYENKYGGSSYDNKYGGNSYNKYNTNGYGSNSANGNGYGSNNGNSNGYGSSSYGADRYGSKYPNQDRIGISKYYWIKLFKFQDLIHASINTGYGTTSPGSSIDNKYYIPGGSYNTNTNMNRNPFENSNGVFQQGGQYPGNNPSEHVFDLHNPSTQKSLLLPLAGAALLGVAAALVVNGGALPLFHMGSAGAMYGKRKRRSLADDKFAQHLVYRGYKLKK